MNSVSVNRDVTLASGGRIRFAPRGAHGGAAALDAGRDSYPFLVDHGFQGMVVLPGSFYVETALALHRECLGLEVGAVRQVEFLHPVILADHAVPLVAMISRAGAVARYEFAEASTTGSCEASGPVCARLEVVPPAAAPEPAPTRFALDDFRSRGADLGEAARIYARLRANGNQYGPLFQVLDRVWSADSEALARVRVPAGAGGFNFRLHPVLLDATAQLLAVLSLALNRTFILQGIGELRLVRAIPAGDLWVRARLLPGVSPESGGRGEVAVLDGDGEACLVLRDVRFTHLGDGEPAAPATRVAIAATFTAEPIAETLSFWGETLGLPVELDFAPYNQVFQQLLTPDSQLRANRDGLNVILLNLADWAGERHAPAPAIEPARAAAAFGDLPRHVLPNGMEVAHLNRHETDYVYQEIFGDRVYLRHGIQLPADATVIDIGANIGLFALFVRRQAPRATVYSYEPSPVAFRALRANCEAYGPGLHPFNVGVSERRGSAQLTFYEKSSVFSSFHSDAEEDRHAIKAVVENMVRGELGERTGSVDDYVEELMADRLQRQTFDCPLVSVSDIVRDQHLPRIDLLKVDAEKCELEILRGIDDGTWPLIDQVVIEVHDRTRRAVAEVQEILGRQGFVCAVEEENLLAGSGLFNVYATRRGTQPAPADQPAAELRAKAGELVEALSAYAAAAPAPTILAFCPLGGAEGVDAGFIRECRQIEQEVLARIGNLPAVHALGSASLLERYPVADLFDRHAHQLGHIPYTAAGFAAIGTAIFRKFTHFRRPPYKVIVLDCDNTLWRGAVAEEGATGVEITPAHRKLQEFMVRQTEAGMLLALCSKNTEADVWSVFELNPGMVLRREHVAAWRINWEPKSASVLALTAELNLGPDSFIFVDDNPVECAEVRANCPAVLVLPLPAAPEQIPAFLEHTWAFDHLQVTEEDRTRTRKVRENVQRERFRGGAATLADFIAGLQLQVEIFEPGADQRARISQLTLRTNQFNFTTLRRSEGEIDRYLREQKGRALGVKVRDRFGDYGLVGLLLFHPADGGVVVDTFLLSCRVLGRGVEYRVLAELGRRAQAEGWAWVELAYRPTDRNRPAADFLAAIAPEIPPAPGGSITFRCPADRLAALRYDPGRRPSTDAVPVEESRTGAAAGRIPSPGVGADWSEKLTRIAGRLRSVAEIASAVETRRLRAFGPAQPDGVTDLPPTLEGKLLGIWRRTIGNPRLGVEDNFFDAGGTSLKAVQTVATIRRELHAALSIVTLFECPTVRLLAAKLNPGTPSAGSAREALERGARRKQMIRRRSPAPDGRAGSGS